MTETGMAYHYIIKYYLYERIY